MLKHTKGNLIDLAEQGEFDVIVHGCNCLNTMGSGIAAEIRQRYPEAYEADTIYSKFTQPIMKLGSWSSTDVMCRSPEQAWGIVTIINAYTQLHYEPRGVDHFEYESFKLILRKLAAIYPDKRFGFPYIGCGLAGGDKDRIIAMLEDFAEKISAQGGSVTLVEFG
jgi:O-acetyl-ADP-ribose deacetylase (regulator of RNase III)